MFFLISSTSNLILSLALIIMYDNIYIAISLCFSNCIIIILEICLEFIFEKSFDSTFRIVGIPMSLFLAHIIPNIIIEYFMIVLAVVGNF